MSTLDRQTEWIHKVCHDRATTGFMSTAGRTELKDVAPSDALRRYFDKLPKGGHFAAWEHPKLFSEEVRAGFRSLQQGSSKVRRR
jgi:pimeloyl-ACP methyl ester carboxylesterase